MSDPVVALARMPSSSDVGGPKSQRQPKDSSDVIARDWEERAKALETVRKKLRSGWRNDEQVLEQYFQSCVETWKKYTGVRPPKKVLKLQGVYKQAMLGDIIDPPPFELKSVEGLKWSAWHNCKGMDKPTAKRRFITLLSEIDPLLIDVMPDEKVITTSAALVFALSHHSHSYPSSHTHTLSLTHTLYSQITFLSQPPDGFPMDRFGTPICAKCNSKVGCARPIMDDRHRCANADILSLPSSFSL